MVITLRLDRIKTNEVKLTTLRNRRYGFSTVFLHTSRSIDIEAGPYPPIGVCILYEKEVREMSALVISY